MSQKEELSRRGVTREWHKRGRMNRPPLPSLDTLPALPFPSSIRKESTHEMLPSSNPIEHIEHEMNENEDEELAGPSGLPNSPDLPLPPPIPAILTTQSAVCTVQLKNSVFILYLFY